MDATVPEARGIQHHLDVIEEITGIRPHTCPWRANYDPIIRRVAGLMSVPEGDSEFYEGSDPPAILLDALKIFRAAQAATIAEERRIADEERERKRGG